MWRLESLLVRWGGTPARLRNHMGELGGEEQIAYTLKNVVTGLHLADTDAGVELHATHDAPNELWTLLPFEAADVGLAFPGGQDQTGHFCLQNVATKSILRCGEEVWQGWLASLLLVNPARSRSLPPAWGQAPEPYPSLC
jgi:hypothetical protein